MLGRLEIRKFAAFVLVDAARSVGRSASQSSPRLSLLPRMDVPYPHHTHPHTRHSLSVSLSVDRAARCMRVRARAELPLSPHHPRSFSRLTYHRHPLALSLSDRSRDVGGWEECPQDTYSPSYATASRAPRAHPAARGAACRRMRMRMHDTHARRSHARHRHRFVCHCLFIPPPAHQPRPTDCGRTMIISRGPLGIPERHPWPMCPLAPTQSPGGATALDADNASHRRG